MSRTVVQFIDTDRFGGAERSLLNLAAALDPARWRPLLLHYDAPGVAPLVRAAADAGIESRAVPPLRGAGLITNLPSVARLLRAVRPTALHAHLNWPLACTGGLIAARWAAVPASVATVHLFGPLPRGPSIAALRRLHPRLVDRYIAVSHDVARRMTDTLRTPAARVRVIHNGIDLAPFLDSGPGRAGARAALGIADGAPCVVTAARLDAQKGLLHLVEAARAVPGAVFLIAGDGPERAAVEAAARRSGVEERVRLLGPRDDVPALLAACDIFVLPSLFEGAPLAILEAMATARPVVASRIGGVDELVLDGVTGLLVPPADPAALAAAILRLTASPELRVRLGDAARERARTFGAPAMAQAVMALYDEVVRPA
jgi:glycosyltransferase involved in cell wall biosynthesis